MGILLDHSHCPLCGTDLPKLQLRPSRAASFDGCVRKCEPCGVAFSNASKNPTRIHRDPLNNIPPEARPGALHALSNAVNVRNRPQKLEKFGFSTSEDALTWSVFSYLQQGGLLSDIVRSLGLLPTPPASEPVLLLWGSPVPPNSAEGELLRTELTSLLDRIG